MPEMQEYLHLVGFEFNGNKCDFSTEDISELEVVNRFQSVSKQIELEERLSLIDDNQIPFEQVIDNDGPRMSKKLGEMSSRSNNHGLSNTVGLILFLGIDLIAIGIGLLLLMN